MNEYGQVIGFYMTNSKSLAEIRTELAAVRQRYQRMPPLLDGPSVFYTDNCCIDRSVLSSIFPTLLTNHDTYNRLPVLKFNGQTSVSACCGTVG